MGLKKDKRGLTTLQRRLMKLSAMPETLDKEMQLLAMQMAETAINMAPIYTGYMRESIRYSRVSSQRNAKGQFFKGGLGIHTITFDYSRREYFKRVHEEMLVGRTGEGGRNVLQPSERSVEAAAKAGETAGGMFMERARLRYEPIIAQMLQRAAGNYIRMVVK